VKQDRSYLCDEKCNECILLQSPNSRMVTEVLNELYNKFGNGVYEIVEKNCPNLTCCYDCHIDDFCHVKGCKIIKENKMNIEEGKEYFYINISCSEIDYIIQKVKIQKIISNYVTCYDVEDKAKDNMCIFTDESFFSEKYSEAHTYLINELKKYEENEMEIVRNNIKDTIEKSNKACQKYFKEEYGRRHN